MIEIILKPEQKFKVKDIVRVEQMGVLQRYIEENVKDTYSGLAMFIPFCRQNVGWK